MSPRTERPWWRDAVVYQIYPRSFADTDGDGVGDLRGITTRMPYLQRLGVDAVWLTPFYESPQADGGYDVADHRQVDPLVGTLRDFDALVRAAHGHGIRVVVDLVPNHTSSAHPWFRAAIADGRGSRARRRYLFRDGSGPDGSVPPNNWRSLFGGPAWTRAVEPDGQPGQWYLHLFDTSQPDLDWTNDDVRDEFESIIRFWLDRGVDGFRIDVAHGMVKDPALPDLEDGHLPTHATVPGHPHWDRDEVHDIYRRWRRLIDHDAPDRVLVGEVAVPDPHRVARYLRSDELHTAFNFHFLDAGCDPHELRRAIDESLVVLGAVGAPSTWVLSNHDVTRHVTRFGDGVGGLAMARAMALLMLALPGSAYLYQGEELGLPEVLDLAPERREDPSFFRSDGATLGRDGCRVPLPWSGDEPPFGFSTSADTWLPQPASWAALTAERQDADPASTLNLYRSALRLRRQLPALGDGDVVWLDTPEAVLAFRRQPGFVCVANLGETPAPVPTGVAGGAMELALASAADVAADTLPPRSAGWWVDA